MFCARGETPESISETLTLMEQYEVPQGVWVTIGISLWIPHQPLLTDARTDGQLGEDNDLLSSAHHVSPQLPKVFMVEVVESLRMTENHTDQVNKLYADSKEH